MKSFVKATLVATAALAVGAIAPAASARTLNYTFTGFCDGISLTQDGNSFGGTHDGCTAQDPAGGLGVIIKHTAGRYIEVATSDTQGAPGIVFTFYLNIPALTWSLYDTSGGVFQLINSGTLTAGAPPAQHGLKSSTSVRGIHPVGPG